MNYTTANASRYWSVTVLIILILSLIAYWLIPGVSIQINRGLSMLKLHDVMGLTIQYHSLSWAMVLAVTLCALQVLIPSLGLGTAVLANLATFGWLTGGLLSWSGLMVGSLLAYAVGRALTYPLRRFWVRMSGNQLPLQIGWCITLAASLLPWWPFKLGFAAAGLLALPVRTMLLAAAVGGMIQVTMLAHWGANSVSYGGLILVWIMGSLIGFRGLPGRGLR